MTAGKADDVAPFALFHHLAPSSLDAPETAKEVDFHYPAYVWFRSVQQWSSADDSRVVDADFQGSKGAGRLNPGLDRGRIGDIPAEEACLPFIQGIKGSLINIKGKDSEASFSKGSDDRTSNPLGSASD